MTQTYQVTWTETVHYTAEVEIDTEDLDTGNLKDIITDHMYEGITNTDVPNGLENIHYEKL